MQQKKKNTFISDCKDIFLYFYSDLGIKYIWKPKDDKGLGGIIQHVKELLKEKYEGKPPAEEVKKTIKFILINLPEWYKKNNCEVMTIYSNLNSIINSIKNGKSKQATASRIENTINKYYSK